jgi:autotransporter-associated beta strand protein
MSLRLHIYCSSFKSHVVRAAALVAALFVAPAAHATLYWDANSALGGNGAWDNGVGTVWSTTNAAGAPNSTWTPNDGTQDAVFNGSASYTATIASGTTINAHSVAFGISAGNVTITGGDALNIADPTNSFVMNTNTSGTARQQIVNTPITGTNITMFAANGVGGVNAFLALGLAGTTGPSNTYSGDLIFAGPNNATSGFSQIAINHPNALPSTATVRMKRNLSQLLFGGGGAAGTTSYSATFNNNIVLNDNAPGTGRLNSDIGAGSGASFANNMVITLGGVISGDANLSFRLGNSGGGQGKIVVANHATYSGTTTIATNAAGSVALGINDAFPIGTTLAANTGKFDMAGFSQRVSGLSGGSNGAITNTSATTSTLTIDGAFTGTYSGKIGSSTLAGSNDNEALLLASTNTGTLTLDTPVIQGINTYSGGTTINGGKLLVTNNVAIQISGTGSGAVTVNNGGTLGGAGGVGVAAGTGSIAVNSGGHLAPGLSGAIGTLTAFNAVTLASGSRLDIDLGAPAPAGGTSDLIDMPNAFGNFALTVPAAASSVGVNLGDPAGGAAGNGTYTLMTFQAGQFSGGTNTAFFTGTQPSPNSLNGATIAYHLVDGSNANQDATPANATKVIMQVSGGPNALLWKGGASGAWDTSALNFDNVGTGATGVAFAGNDNVTFDDTGANTNPITVAGAGVQPNIVTINNSTTPYAFSGGDIKGSSVGGTGGLILGGTGAVTIDNKYTAVGPIISNKTGAGTATINGAITAATSVTINGGAVTLGGANTYTGNNTVSGGSLTVSGASATFGAGNLAVNAGSAVISAGVTNAILDSATLTLLGGGTAGTADVGFISLAAGINERVGSLFLGATNFTSGTFGATGSGATNIFDEYFSGSGIITVGAAGLPGDFNSDGKVDAGDYATWRKNDGANAQLPNDNNVGNQAARFSLWRANFGKPPGAGSSLAGGGAVPEPATSLLGLFAIGVLGIVFRRRSAGGR